MKSARRIIKLDPLKASDEVWSMYFEQKKELSREMDPDEPMLARDKEKALVISSCSNPSRKIYTYLLTTGDGPGDAAASFSLEVETPLSPTYAANKHIGRAVGDLFVSAKYRDRGFSKALLRHVLAELAHNEPAVTELAVSASLEIGRRAVEKLGGKLSSEHAESRLYLKDVNWPMVVLWDAEGVKRNHGATIATVDAIPEEDIEDYSRAYTETINQQALEGLELRRVATPEQIRYYESRNREQGYDHISLYCREASGEVSGLTETHYLASLPHKLLQMFTGVRAKYRGRGLGKLLKARMLLHVRNNFPNVKYLVTSNATTNLPMLAINTKLGFKPHLSVGTYQLKITPKLLKALGRAGMYKDLEGIKE